MVEADGRNLVFILSTPRAGSTWLAAMLGSHPDVCAPPEPWLLLPLFALDSEAAQIIAAYDDQLARHAVRASTDEQTLSRARAAFATTVYNDALRAHGKRVFVDKTPRYYHCTDELEATFPRAKKIWLLRNPLDVIASCCATWQLSLDEVLGDTLSPHSFDATVAFVRLSAYFARQTSEQMLVRYEDLARDASAQLRRICAHLGVAFAPAMLAYRDNAALMERYAASTLGDKRTLALDGPATHAIGRWRAAFTPAEVQRVLTTLGSEIFATLDYTAEWREAAAFAGLSENSVSRRGRLDQLGDLAVGYALHHLPDSAGGQRTMQVKQLLDLRRQITDLQQQLADLRGQVAHDPCAPAELAPAPAPTRPRWLERVGLGRLFAPRQP